MYLEGSYVATTRRLHKHNGDFPRVPAGSYGLVILSQVNGAWIKFDGLEYEVFVPYSSLRPTGLHSEDRFMPAYEHMYQDDPDAA